MKCLSVSQPFAYLIVSGKKTIEIRNWNTNFRGEFLIHAPIKLRTLDCKRLKINLNLPTGVIVGKATLYDVKKYLSLKDFVDDEKFHLSSQEFENKKYGFLLKNPRAFRIPIPFKGKLGLYDAEIPKTKIKKKDIITDLIDEEFRYQWIGHH